MKNNIARLATLAEHQALMLYAGLAPLCLIWVAEFATIVLPHWFASRERGLFIAALTASVACACYVRLAAQRGRRIMRQIEESGHHTRDDEGSC